MRPIKFRAKRIDTGTWVYGHYFKTPLTQENIDTPPENGWFFLTGQPRHCIEQDFVAYEIDPKTLGEFTGLHDKNGKEIWEGDIANISWTNPYTEELRYTERGEMRWLEKEAQFAFFVKDSLLHEDMTNLEIEVLGNIYENPELLK